MNGQPVALLAWYRNHALPQGEDLCFSLEPAGDLKVAAAQIADMHASGTTLSSDVEVVLLESHFADQDVELMNQLIGLEDLLLRDQDRSVGMIRSFPGPHGSGREDGRPAPGCGPLNPSSIHQKVADLPR